MLSSTDRIGQFDETVDAKPYVLISQTDIYTAHHYVTFLLETNIVRYVANQVDSPPTRGADMLRALRGHRETTGCTRPVLVEFRSGCARPPSARDAFDLSTATAERRTRDIERDDRLFPNYVAKVQLRRQAFLRSAVSGVKVQEVRLIAPMKVYWMTDQLTWAADSTRR
jgi:hypothetical protein